MVERNSPFVHCIQGVPSIQSQRHFPSQLIAVSRWSTFLVLLRLLLAICCIILTLARQFVLRQSVRNGCCSISVACSLSSLYLPRRRSAQTLADMFTMATSQAWTLYLDLTSIIQLIPFTLMAELVGVLCVGKCHLATLTWQHGMPKTKPKSHLCSACNCCR